MTNRKTLLAALAALALLASPALAGNGHGGGNAGGNGHGNGGSNGNGGNGKSGASHGKSSSAPGQVAKADDTTVDKTTKVSSVPKGKNIHAKLGRVSSLKRNINAYMNSKSKKFAALQAFVTQSAKAKVAQAAADAAQAKLDALTSMTPDQIAALSPDDQAALPGKIAARQAEVAADNAAAAAAAVGTDDASLDAALADMANKPVDAAVTSWAQDVLAGKIDQTAAAMQTETTP
ncbi:hypothetical protein EN925_33885 [Mesorhizobium sp. M7A.F.Ca.US.006.04.2.1]|uniref:hypothetical protein n=1 Tax=Mesorhizobium sp. M7A.F.Ca.US.006.04.2.1 TaxID=2496696 RepID=UPI000FD1DF0F|nr:hypothetical protein [Mesorhizobium sp. M7A.F.Ca.US.006.04.2.1]RVA78987.1 hypothetical protein EN925_33885 [Mesorhizobium sp. M7A.F.Ca.US.006.04.2.1]